MYKKIVRKIEEWRNNFNLLTNGKGKLSDFSLAISLVDEEEAEYRDAVSKGDTLEIIDALADRIFVYVQIINVFWGITPKYTLNPVKAVYIRKIKRCISELKYFGDPYDIIMEVYNSNMSKSCNDIIEAKESVDNYKTMGISAYYEKHGDIYLIYRLRDNKLLKGIHFFKPNLNKFICTKK